MFFLTMPDHRRVQALLTVQSTLPFSYDAVGATATTPPANYVVDHNRRLVGHGAMAFAAACTAVQRWAMFDLGWIDLLWPDAPIVEGTTVGIMAHLPGVHLLNACRIVYVIDEKVGNEEIKDKKTEPVSRFGFAYGTLPGHVERGEERFLIEWQHSDDTVWYDILAFSQPKHWLVKLGYPVTRFYQRRFACTSLARMAQAIS